MTTTNALTKTAVWLNQVTPGRGAPFVASFMVALLGLDTAQAQPIAPAAPNWAWTFDDGAGATTAAAAFGSVNGQISGPVDSATTALGYAGNRSLEFDGIDDLVTLEGINISGEDNNGFSISAWVYSRDVNGVNEGVIFGNWFQGDDPQVLMLQEMDNNRTRLIVRQFDGSAGSVGPVQMPKDQWVHLVGVWDGADVGGVSSFYINGELIAEGNANLLRSLPDEAIYGIGGDSGVAAAVRYFDGFIDEVSVWRSALSAENVEWLSQNSVQSIPEPRAILLAGLSIVMVLCSARCSRRTH